MHPDTTKTIDYDTTNLDNAIRIVDNATDSANSATRIAVDPTKIPLGCRSFVVNMFL